VAGNALYLLGRSRPELGGSLWARRHGRRGLAVPPGDPAGLRRLGESLLRAFSRREAVSAHDVSDGGLGAALAEMAFGGGLGFTVDLAATGLEGPGIAAVVEGGSRLVVEVPAGKRSAFERTLRGVPSVPIGTVTEGEGLLRWGSRTAARLPLDELYGRWRTGLALP